MSKDERGRAVQRAIEGHIQSIGNGVQSLSANDLSQLRSLLGAHAEEVRAARAGAASERGEGGRSAAAVADHLAAVIAPLVLARFASLLPIGVDGHPPRRAPSEATATEYAETIAAIFAWEASVGPDTRLRSAVRGQIAAVTRACRTRIEAHLQVQSDDDIPDVRLLSRDILRIEAVEWAVEVAAGSGQAEEIRRLAHHAARKAIQWAGHVFDRFKAGPSEFSHFDAVATVSAADDLLVVILRVLEGDRDDRAAGSHPFVLTLGEQAMQEFVSGLEHMTKRYLDIADLYLLRSGTDGAFLQSILLVLHRILRLSHALLPWLNIMELRLNHDATVIRMVALRSKLRASLRDPDAPRDYRARLAVLETALGELGV